MSTPSRFLFILPLFTAMLGCGCGGSPGVVKTPGVGKVAVMLDGTVYLNGDRIPVDSLPSKLDELGDLKEIWYHRESPTKGQHENVMKVVREIDRRKVPIELYLDPEFTNRWDTD